MKRLIIATDTTLASTSSRNGLTAFLEGKGWPIWHWFEDLWLIDGAPDDITVGALRSEILSAVPTLRAIMIMTAEGDLDFAGMVPSASTKWFDEHWKTGAR